jgi:hypothetical protein
MWPSVEGLRGIMDRLKRNKDFLQQLRKKDQRLKTLKKANFDQVKIFADCAKNILEGNIKPTKAKLQQLKQMKTGIRLLARKSVPLKKKKKILTQKGGLIGSILVPIISAVAGLIMDKVI